MMPNQEMATNQGLRILFAHNAYLQRGGEESVVEAEIEMLRRYGHEVELYQRDNREIEQLGSARVLRDTVWSRRSASELADLARRFKPDVVHAHNIFPLISPSI